MRVYVVVGHGLNGDASLGGCTSCVDVEDVIGITGYEVAYMVSCDMGGSSA